MSHEDLIITLASHAEAVTPLPAPRVRMVRWVACALVAVGIGVAWRGLRTNWAMAFGDPTFLITNALMLMVALLSAWLALTLAVPGALKSSWTRWLPIAGLGAWGAILLQQLAVKGHVVSTLVSERVIAACLWKTYGIAVGPAFIIILLAQRAAPLDWRWTGGLAALSALAFGVIGTELICPITGLAHLFNWHFGPVGVMTLIAFAAGARIGRG